MAERIALLAERQAACLERFHGNKRSENIRRTGTIAALDLKARDGGCLADIGPKLLAFFGERYLLVRALGSTFYVLPPYCAGEDDLDRVDGAIAAAADTLA